MALDLRLLPHRTCSRPGHGIPIKIGGSTQAFNFIEIFRHGGERLRVFQPKKSRRVSQNVKAYENALAANSGQMTATGGRRTRGLCY